MYMLAACGSSYLLQWRKCHLGKKNISLSLKFSVQNWLVKGKGETLKVIVIIFRINKKEKTKTNTGNLLTSLCAQGHMISLLFVYISFTDSTEIQGKQTDAWNSEQKAFIVSVFK